mgnify:FL=1
MRKIISQGNRQKMKNFQRAFLLTNRENNFRIRTYSEHVQNTFHTYCDSGGILMSELRYPALFEPFKVKHFSEDRKSGCENRKNRLYFL